MFLHGFNAWRNGEIVVRHKGKEPFTAMAEGPFPISFATEVWGWMTIGAAFALLGVVGIVKFLISTPTQRQAALTRLDGVTLRDSRGEKIPWSAAIAVIGGVVAFFIYLAFRVHTS